MSQRKGFTKFVSRTLLALLPVALYVALYLVMDPFRVVHPYDGIAIPAGDTLDRIPNKRFVALEGFEVYQPQQQFDSFIFGSSISTNFHAEAWKRHLPADARVYHFTESAQTLTGIRDELRWLVAHGVKVRHVMLVMEEEMFQRPKRYSEMPFIPHYKVSPEVTRLDFHRVHFNALRDMDMLLFTLCPRLSVDRLIADGKMALAPTSRNEVMNEEYNTQDDSLVLNDPDNYYASKGLSWLAEMPLPPEAKPLSIDAETEAVLREIADVLRENNIDYVVIVPPRYMCPALAPLDHALLCEILGDDQVNDFTGDSVLVHELQSYYDGIHVITPRCDELIDRCYEPKFQWHR